MLAYSASNDEADELRRLSILGRAGPPEHLAWIGQCGHLRRAARQPATSSASTPAPNSACGRAARSASTTSAPDRGAAPAFAGTIWVQEGSRPLADDADDVLRGAAVLAARIMSRLAATPSTHAVRVQELLGLRDADVDDARGRLARELGIVADGRAAVIGFDGAAGAPARLADVLALSASAFRHDAQVAADGVAGLRAVPPHRQGRRR